MAKKALADLIAELGEASRKPGFDPTAMPKGLLLMVEPEVTVGCVIVLPDDRPVPTWLAASLARAIGKWGKEAAGEIQQRRLKLADGMVQ